MQLTELNTLIQKVNSTNQNEIWQQLQAAVNHLIVNDFEKLVRILYTVDVDEKRLKALLKERSGEDAAAIITDLLIARQLQKIALRQQYKKDSTPEDNEEKW